MSLIHLPTDRRLQAQMEKTSRLFSSPRPTPIDVNLRNFSLLKEIPRKEAMEMRNFIPRTYTLSTVTMKLCLDQSFRYEKTH